MWYLMLATVCIKAGDLTLALEVFDDMKLKNCNPNLVTYNILIDVLPLCSLFESA
jgi:pentatricopeptide repeat protein